MSALQRILLGIIVLFSLVVVQDSAQARRVADNHVCDSCRWAADFTVHTSLGERTSTSRWPYTPKGLAEAEKAIEWRRKQREWSEKNFPNDTPYFVSEGSPYHFCYRDASGEVDKSFWEQIKEINEECDRFLAQWDDIESATPDITSYFSGPVDSHGSEEDKKRLAEMSETIRYGVEGNHTFRETFDQYNKDMTVALDEIAFGDAERLVDVTKLEPTGDIAGLRSELINMGLTEDEAFLVCLNVFYGGGPEGADLYGGNDIMSRNEYILRIRIRFQEKEYEQLETQADELADSLNFAHYPLPSAGPTPAPTPAPKPPAQAQSIEGDYVADVSFSFKQKETVLQSSVPTIMIAGDWMTLERSYHGKLYIRTIKTGSEMSWSQEVTAAMHGREELGGTWVVNERLTDPYQDNTKHFSPFYLDNKATIVYDEQQGTGTYTTKALFQLEGSETGHFSAEYQRRENGKHGEWSWSTRDEAESYLSDDDYQKCTWPLVIQRHSGRDVNLIYELPSCQAEYYSCFNVYNAIKLKLSFDDNGSVTCSISLAPECGYYRDYYIKTRLEIIQKNGTDFQAHQVK